MSHSIRSLPRPSRIARDRILFQLPVLALVLALFPGRPFASEQQTPLILGVHPYLTADELFKRFTPLANYLGEQLGRPVEVRVGQNYQSHIEAIGNNRIDLAYIGPSIYVHTTRRYGSKPLLARLEINGKPNFVGYIITREASPLRSLQDLKSRIFAFGDPQSTMSSLLPRAMMLEQGIKKSDLAGFSHVHGHENVALTVLAGDADAGAVKEEVFHQYSAQGLRVLAVTPPISEHLFIASSTLPPPVVDKLRQSLLGIRQPELVSKLLKPIKNTITALVSVTDQDYDNLRILMEPLSKD